MIPEPFEIERVLLDQLHVDPENPDLLAEYGLLMLQTLHLDKARALVTEALAHSPDHAQARVLELHLDIIDDETSGAETAAIDLLRTHPRSLGVAWTLVRVLVDNQKYAAAIELLQAILHAAPNDEDAMDVLIEIQAISHWSCAPLRLLLKYGFAANITIWMVAIMAAVTLGAMNLLIPFGVVVVLFFLYCLYSWTWLHLLKRILPAPKVRARHPRRR